MTVKRKVPEIRFKGFGGEWEEKRFGDIVLIQRGGSPRPIEDYITTHADGINWIKIGDVDTESRYITSTKEKIIPAGEKNSRRVFVGDLILSNSMSFGRPYIMKIEGCIHDGWLLIRDEKNIFDIEYLLQLLSSNYMLKQYRSLAAGGVVINLNSDLVQSTNVWLPSRPEQSKIGTFFQNLDSLITLHQRKYNKLTTVKKAILEKMFPKDGADVPEIRFKGFTEKWERRTLGEVLEISSAARVHKNEWTQTGVPFFRSSDVVAAYNGKTNSKAFISVELYQELSKSVGRVQQNDILVTGGGSIGIPYLVESNEPLYFKDADLLWFKNSENINGRFLYTFLRTTVFRGYLQSITHIGTISHYTIEQAKSTPIKLPNLNEQNKIEEFFQKLDSLITLQQRELDKLKNIKKACLERMFV